jgi:hypothetical protein
MINFKKKIEKQTKIDSSAQHGETNSSNAPIKTDLLQETNDKVPSEDDYSNDYLNEDDDDLDVELKQLIEESDNYDKGRVISGEDDIPYKPPHI